MSVGKEGYGPVVKLTAFGLSCCIEIATESSSKVIKAPADSNLVITEERYSGFACLIFTLPPVIATAVR